MTLVMFSASFNDVQMSYTLNIEFIIIQHDISAKLLNKAA